MFIVVYTLRVSEFDINLNDIKVFSETLRYNV